MDMSPLFGLTSILIIRNYFIWYVLHFQIVGDLRFHLQLKNVRKFVYGSRKEISDIQNSFLTSVHMKC